MRWFTVNKMVVILTKVTVNAGIDFCHECVCQLNLVIVE